MTIMGELLDNIRFPEDIRKLDNKSLIELAGEIRSFIIQSVSKTGGHLASNLGVVELTLAVHCIYNMPHDKVIFDVGHQTYVHKILTGRKEIFNSLRNYGGLSGFPKKCESAYDIFETGHSSTSISAALGMSRARDIKGEDYNVVAVIGDGALTGGMAFEALNDAGDSNTNITVILNDNQMSISKNVGGLSAYLSNVRTEPAYFKIKENIENILKGIPGIGKNIAKVTERLKDSFKYFLVPGMLFEELGFTYLGPIDGHNIIKLKDVLERSKKVKGPVFIHVVTKKGKGYELAEEKPERFHGIGKFDIDTGEPFNKCSNSYSDVFGNELVEIAKTDKRIISITAAMPEGTGLSNFAKLFPERFFDVGIAEQHAVTLAAGLAASGMKPVFAVYSTFLQRAFDQVIHDVCMQKLPVLIAIDRGGIVGEDGETHQGVFDFTYLRSIPNIVIMAPKSTDELKKMLRMSFSMNCPTAIRYPRGGDIDGIHFEDKNDFKPYKSEVILRGNNILVISAGRMTSFAYKAALELKKSNINIGLINARFIKPLDKETILNEVKKYKSIITIEDNVINGGFGSGILELLSENDLFDKKIKLLGFPDEFIPHGSVNILFKKYKLDADGIMEHVIKMF